MLLVDTGWLRDKYRRELSLIRFWNRFLKMPNESLTKQVFLWDYEKSYKIGQMTSRRFLVAWIYGIFMIKNSFVIWR